MQGIVSESYTDKQKRFRSYVKNKGQESIGSSTPQKQRTMASYKAITRVKRKSSTNSFPRFSQEVTTAVLPSKAIPGSPYPAMPDILINKKGVQKLLKDLNPHKATGPDEVPSRILKIGAEELSPALVKLYQHSIDVGEVLQE